LKKKKNRKERKEKHKKTKIKVRLPEASHAFLLPNSSPFFYSLPTSIQLNTNKPWCPLMVGSRITP